MHVVLLTSAFFSVVALAATGSTTTTWDCCKPACSDTRNTNKLKLGLSGIAAACYKNNTVLDAKITGAASNACFGSSGTAYSCSTYQPIIVNSSFSYVFAGNWETANCCKCFHVTWTSGAGRGKSMIVQVINAFGVNTGDFDLYTPGGGVGGLEACQSQYGAPRQGWGAQYGGVQSLGQCNQLPASLQDGCKWRFNWAGGTVNGWSTTYNQVTCPTEMTDISHCSA